MKGAREVTNKTEKADAVDARSATAEEADDKQQCSDADEKRRRAVQRLPGGRRRVGPVRRTGGGCQQRAVPEPISLSMLPQADADQ